MDLFTPFITRPRSEPEAKQDIAIKKISAMPHTRKLSDKRKELSAKLSAKGDADHVVTEGEIVGINADAEDFTYDAHGLTHPQPETPDENVPHIDVNEASLLDSDVAEDASTNTDDDPQLTANNANHWDDWA